MSSYQSTSTSTAARVTQWSPSVRPRSKMTRGSRSPSQIVRARTRPRRRQASRRARPERTRGPHHARTQHLSPITDGRLRKLRKPRAIAPPGAADHASKGHLRMVLGACSLVDKSRRRRHDDERARSRALPDLKRVRRDAIQPDAQRAPALEARQTFPGRRATIPAGRPLILSIRPRWTYLRDKS
jgi:hypothetical protein